MKTLLTVLAVIITLCFADSLSDNPEVNKPVPAFKKSADVDSTLCPNCSDTGCIYYQIETEIVNAGGDGTDSEIKAAAERVFILRGITDRATIKNVLSNYYL